MTGSNAPASYASPTSPASTQERKTRLPGWRAILVRDETFLRLQSIQASRIDPHLDLRYLGDASVLLTLDELSPAHIVKRAVEEMKRHL
jgi:hypothetical protein